MRNEKSPPLKVGPFLLFFYKKVGAGWGMDFVFLDGGEGLLFFLGLGWVFEAPFMCWFWCIEVELKITSMHSTSRGAVLRLC